MPDDTNFGMAAFKYGTIEDYLAHVIAVLQIIEKKGLASETKVAWDAILKVTRDMMPYFQFPDEDETEAAKELWKQTLSKYKEILKAKKVFVVAKTQKAFKMFRLFAICNPQTQWDKIVHEMHTKDPWIGVNGSSNKGPCTRSWPSFLDCIELHKLFIFPVDAAEKQHYYMTQTVKKPQRAMVRQYMAHMGILNNYLAHLPTVFNSPMAVEGTKKGNVPFDEADLAGIVLNSVLVSWMNQYSMTHTTPLDRSRTLLQDLELIELVMDEKHEAGQQAKVKEAATSAIAKGSSKKRSVRRR
jgi:hypothetical protein